jgi:hypothetical protein
MLDVRGLLEAHPLYSQALDWELKPGRSIPYFHDNITTCFCTMPCFVLTGVKIGKVNEYRYVPELVLEGGAAKAGSTKGQRGYGDMGRRSKNMN